MYTLMKLLFLLQNESNIIAMDKCFLQDFPSDGVKCIKLETISFCETPLRGDEGRQDFDVGAAISVFTTAFAAVIIRRQIYSVLTQFQT